MSELNENWQKENLEKSKEVLNEHFERRKSERMLKEMRMLKERNMAFRPQLTTIELHTGSNWEIDESEISDFYDKLVWEDNTIEKKPLLKKIIDKIGMSYWNLLFLLWKIKQKITKK